MDKSTLMRYISRSRQEARDIIRTAVNASEDDTVIFSGHGCADALEKLISALDFRDASIIFTGPTEHHDNLNLWQKTGAKVSFLQIGLLSHKGFI